MADEKQSSIDDEQKFIEVAEVKDPQIEMLNGLPHWVAYATIS